MDESGRLKRRGDSSRRKGLKRELTLFDVYAISTGAMFSSGFFLLPGLAVTFSGPSVILAYLVASILVIPAMLSKAELSTAMPRAGGTYYFLDRSMGPLVGSVGGFGTWLSLSFKSAFALLGMGAYLHLFLDIPIHLVALGLTALFMVLNIVGAKESTRIQGVLVIALVVILALFLVQGLAEVFTQAELPLRERFSPFLAKGSEGLLVTVGLVFVSYGGLTKVSSVAEEVKDPDRNIPLGMILSLLTATFVYVLGTFIMVALLGVDGLEGDLTPVATTEEEFSLGLPGAAGLILIVVAAAAAFASTANAGIMSASRYLLAMGRDRMVWDGFARLGRFRTPTLSILATASLIALCLMFLDIVSVAKLASAFKLMIFALVNLAVIIMRESGLHSYDPGFRSPLYPWIQIVGFMGPLALIAELGHMPILFTCGVTAASLGWYFYYARTRVQRSGAVLHMFERLGRGRFEGLEAEMRSILVDKGARTGDPFDEVVARADVIDVPEGADYEDIARQAAGRLARRLPITERQLLDGLLGKSIGAMPEGSGVALPHLRLPGIESPEMVLVRSLDGIVLREDQRHPDSESTGPIHAALFLVSPEATPRLHLRILAELASRVSPPEFMDDWMTQPNEQQLKETLMRDEGFLSLQLTPGERSEVLIGKAIRQLDLPEDCLVVLVFRGNDTIVPKGGTVLGEGDRLTIIGKEVALRRLVDQYGTPLP